MIADRDEFRVAVRNLRIFEQSLSALRAQLEAANPDLLAATSPAYVRRIQALQREIAEYVCDHPTEVSWLLLPGDPAEAQPLVA